MLVLSLQMQSSSITQMLEIKDFLEREEEVIKYITVLLDLVVPLLLDVGVLLPC